MGSPWNNRADVRTPEKDPWEAADPWADDTMDVTRANTVGDFRHDIEDDFREISLDRSRSTDNFHSQENHDMSEQTVFQTISAALDDENDMKESTTSYNDPAIVMVGSAPSWRKDMDAGKERSKENSDIDEWRKRLQSIVPNVTFARSSESLDYPEKNEGSGCPPRVEGVFSSFPNGYPLPGAPVGDTPWPLGNRQPGEQDSSVQSNSGETSKGGAENPSVQGGYARMQRPGEAGPNWPFPHGRQFDPFASTGE